MVVPAVDLASLAPMVDLAAVVEEDQVPLGVLVIHHPHHHHKVILAVPHRHLILLALVLAVVEEVPVVLEHHLPILI